MLDPEHSRSLDLGSEKLIPLNKLWAEVSMFPVRDATPALHLLLGKLCKLLGGCDASWMVLRKESKLPRDISADHYQTIFEAMNGWAPVTAEYLNPDKVFKRVADRWLMHARKEGVDPITRVMLDGAGKYTRSRTRHDVATDEEWEHHWISKHFNAFYGIGERLLAISPLNKKCEACIIIDRPVGAEPYMTADRDFLVFALANVSTLNKRLCMERGLLGTTALLSKRETDTYRLLLTDLSESEIAASLKLSTHTVHDYARQLYRKFGVKGRVGLMAMVLGG